MLECYDGFRYCNHLLNLTCIGNLVFEAAVVLLLLVGFWCYWCVSTADEMKVWVCFWSSLAMVVCGEQLFAVISNTYIYLHLSFLEFTAVWWKFWYATACFSKLCFMLLCYCWRWKKAYKCNMLFVLSSKK